MANMRKMIAVTVATALVATSVTPAFARHGYGKYRHGGHYGRHYKRDRLDTGDVIGIVAVIGLIAAIASSGSNAKRRAREGVDNRDYNSGVYTPGSLKSENAAVDACALAAEDRAGKMSSVREITKVSASSEGWDVEGIVEARDDWRKTAAQTRNFNCVVREGSIKAVFVDVSAVAAR